MDPTGSSRCFRMGCWGGPVITLLSIYWHFKPEKNNISTKIYDWESWTTQPIQIHWLTNMLVHDSIIILLQRWDHLVLDFGSRCSTSSLLHFLPFLHFGTCGIPCYRWWFVTFSSIFSRELIDTYPYQGQI